MNKYDNNFIKIDKSLVTKIGEGTFKNMDTMWFMSPLPSLMQK